jgi:hypothetical protein
MKTIMGLDQLTSIQAIHQFLDGIQAVAFTMATNKQDRYRWVQKAGGASLHTTWQGRQGNRDPLPDESNGLFFGSDQTLFYSLSKFRLTRSLGLS